MILLMTLKENKGKLKTIKRKEGRTPSFNKTNLLIKKQKLTVINQSNQLNTKL